MDNLVGKTFAGYEIVEQIDEAARTLVYKGYQNVENRFVAIKVLKPFWASDPAVLQSFLQYAHLAASMQYPNILPVLDSGVESGVSYLVAPFMENRSVAEHRSVYYELHEAQTLIAGINRGLDQIYGQGYVHGNLKPTNILLGDQWQPMLADFGIAMRQDEAATPYNSPEQVRGGVVNQRTDVYALGIILYELMTGQAPAPGTMFNLSALRPDLPLNVSQIIIQATAQNPEQRFQIPHEFLRALIMVTAAPAEVLTPVPTPTPATPPPIPQTITQTVEVPQQDSSIPWVAIILGAIAAGVICACLILAGPSMMRLFRPPFAMTQPVAGLPTETPLLQLSPTLPPVLQPTLSPTFPPTVQPTEPPILQPTQSPIAQPTLPPAVQPTEPPILQPTQPSEVQPTQLPLLQPTLQVTQPIAPGETPAEGAGGAARPPICGSVGIPVGFVLMGAILALNRRKRF